MDNSLIRTTGDRRRGSALVVSLLAVIIIASLGAYIVELQSAFSRRQCAAIDRKRALYIAEAGLAEAVLAVSQGRSGRLGDEETPVRFHAGLYWVESDPLDDGCIMLSSHARVGVGHFAVRIVVRPNVHDVGNVGFYGTEGVVIGDAVVVDGYNSGLGRYEEQVASAYSFPTTGAGALVRSNQSIVLDDAVTWPAGDPSPYALCVNTLPVASRARLALEDPTSAPRLQLSSSGLAPLSTHVLGTLRPGPDHSIESSGNSLLSELEPSEHELRLPEILSPLTRRDLTGSLIVVDTVVELGDVSARADWLQVDPGGEFVLRGPVVLHLEKLWVRPGGMLRLDDRNGPIHLHLDDLLRLDAGSFVVSVGADIGHGGTFVFVEPAADPALDNRVLLHSVGVFRGVLYAPADRVELPTGLRFFGAASAKHLTIKDGAWVTFDEAVRAGGTGMPGLPRQQLWQVLTEDVVAARLGIDPLTDLARRGVTPLSWSDASSEQDVIATYIDFDGLTQTYIGPLTDAQIAAMERVISLSWFDPTTSTYLRPLRPAGMDPDDLIKAYRDQVRAER